MSCNDYSVFKILMSNTLAYSNIKLIYVIDNIVKTN